MMRQRRSRRREGMGMLGGGSRRRKRIRFFSLMGLFEALII